MILGTAGHIDHGKTTLVRALTGVDTDWLPEEKRRGITIELGFAPLTLDGLEPIGIVDVPGHDGFVRTMLAGATGMDLALLVIAADEGIDLVYVYVGPRDGKNRPFCKTWVGKAVTQPSGMDNGQGLDVADYCGGYNCRHSWAPTPTDEALRLGYRIFDTSANGQGDDITDRLRQQLQVA